MLDNSVRDQTRKQNKNKRISCVFTQGIPVHSYGMQVKLVQPVQVACDRKLSAATQLCLGQDQGQGQSCRVKVMVGGNYTLLNKVATAGSGTLQLQVYNIAS